MFQEELIRHVVMGKLEHELVLLNDSQLESVVAALDEELIGKR